MSKTATIMNTYRKALSDVAAERRRVQVYVERGEYRQTEAETRYRELDERERQARRDALAALRDERRDAMLARQAAEEADPLLILASDQLNRAAAALPFIERDVEAGLLDPAGMADRMAAALDRDDRGALFALLSVARRETAADHRWRVPVEQYGRHLGDEKAIAEADERIAAANRAIAELDGDGWTVSDIKDKYLAQAGVLRG